MTKQFNTTKEELQKLGQEFKLQAFTLLDDLFNLAFWLVLKKRVAKKAVWITYKKAIYYCDKTKATADWNAWMHRIFFNRIFDYYSANPRAEEFGFELIDNLKVDSNLVLKFKEIYSDRIKEKELTKLLRNVPQLLLLPLVLKEVANLSYRTIAEFIDVPDGVISTRIYRARKLIFIKLLILDFEESNSVSEKSDLIFKLRVTAELLDNELPSSEKDASEEKIKTDPRLKKEYEVQELVKKVLKNSFVTKTSPERLKQKIKKKAESSFSVKI